MQFKISKELLEQIEQLIHAKNDNELEILLNDLHHADIAEIFDELAEEAIYIFKILDSEKTAEILTELEEDVREKILRGLSAKEIAEELDELDTDDAADIIAELPQSKKEEVISELEDVEHAKDIVDLLRYDEDFAGGLMGKELVKVNENWNVLTCVKEMRIQAENVTRVHSIYVVDDENRLKGRLSLKDLLTTSTKTPISEVYIKKVDLVRVSDTNVEVARIMQKYDLEAIPVVDEMGRLVGRITIDDIVDVIKDEADKDYQLAAGISQDVEADDSIIELTKARLPWLVLALFGGFISVTLLEGFQGAMEFHKELFFFTPLIAAMAGNVGVQSSAIIVQGLANHSISGTIVNRLLKETSLSLLNGLILASLLFLGSHFLLGVDSKIGVIVTIALVSVIIIASLIGTSIPLVLGTFEQILVSPLNSFEILLGKLLPALIISIVESSFILFIAIFLFGVPLNGSIWLLYLSVIVFLFSMSGIGLFISSISNTQQQAILGSFVVMLPSFLLSGFATPISNMPSWLQPFTDFIPLKYYLELIKGVFLKDISFDIALNNLTPMFLFGVISLYGTIQFFKNKRS